MIRFLLRLVTAALLATSASALAAPAPGSPEPQSSPAIATHVDASADADIAARIRSIFGQIAALHTVTVQVSAGVVTLSGPVPTAEDRERARRSHLAWPAS
jgi:small conductance mechanosensitive channel